LWCCPGNTTTLALGRAFATVAVAALLYRVDSPPTSSRVGT
jgi:hypothetical protein